MPARLRHSCSVAGLAFTAALLGACALPPAEEALQLVERYNDAVAAAYRSADLSAAAPLLGPAEARRIQSLIEVRADRGLVLDSHLLSLEILDARRGPQEFQVRTRERWRYCDRPAASGPPLADPVVDAYEMIYVFRRNDGAWRAEEIRFATSPEVGRKQFLWSGEPTARTHPAGGPIASPDASPTAARPTAPGATPSPNSQPTSQP